MKKKWSVKKFFYKKRRNKEALTSMDTDKILAYGIALLVLAIMFIGYMIFSGKMSGAIEYVKNLFRFGK